MDSILLFAALSILITAVSWRTISGLKSHGLYRFLAWECIAWLFAANYTYWFKDPFSIHQVISWTLLIISVYLVIAAVVLFKRAGQQDSARDEKGLYRFEKTTQLIDTGIFKYIRHPMYSSLLFLAWGIFFKHMTAGLSVAAALSTVFLYLTAVFDEKECIAYFGDRYVEYMKKTKRFVPFLF